MNRSIYLLGAAGLLFLSSWASGSTDDSPNTAPVASTMGSGDAGVILIEGTGNAGEGWVEFAPLGSNANGPSGGSTNPELVRLPFSVLGHTKILINMDHAEWVYSVGQPTNVTNLSHRKSGNTQEALPPILVSKGSGEGFLEFVTDAGQVINLPSREDYLFPQEGFRYIKLPEGSAVKLLD
ncbi:MAG: hypothetical protein ACPG31_07715 [Planctomycetota bacterium]